MDPVVAALFGVAGGALGAAVLVVLVRWGSHALGAWLRLRVIDGPRPARFSRPGDSPGRRPDPPGADRSGH